MKYILFVKEECPFCIKAQSLLEDKGLDYKIVNFDETQQDILQEIKDAHSWVTVPMIFGRNKNSMEFIGGYTDLVASLNSNG